MAKEQKRAPIKALLVRSLLYLLGNIHPLVSYYLARLLGVLLWPLSAKTKKTIRINLKRCYPEQSEQARKRLARRTFTNSIISLFELAYFWVGKVEKYQKISIVVPDKSLLDEAVAQEQGTLLACPHLGHWELVNYFLASHYELMALYRPPRIQELDSFMTRSRERFGGELIPATAQGVKYLYRNLTQKKVLAILPDQEPGESGGIFAPFFGHEAWTMTLLSKLQKKTRAKLLYCFAERIGPLKYQIHILPSVEPPADIKDAVAALNLGVESCVQLCPEQYQWTYKRFKTRPESEAAVSFYAHL